MGNETLRNGMATGFQLAPRGRAVGAALLAAASLVASIAAPTSRGEDAPARRVGVLFEGSFAAAEVTRRPEGARRTQLVAAYEWDYGVRHFSEAKWRERGFDWDRFLPAARRVADSLVGEIEPRYVRDERGVIEYAVVAHEDPFLTSIILSPQLLERFRDTLGDRLHALLLDRQVVYLFPATGGAISEYGPALVERFRRTDLPVSLEVFLVDEDGFRVVGELERSSGNPALGDSPSPDSPDSGGAPPAEE